MCVCVCVCVCACVSVNTVFKSAHGRSDIDNYTNVDAISIQSRFTQ